MNTECMYVLKTQTMDAAKDFCKYLENLDVELFPTYVSIAKQDFRVTPDYDGYMTPFTVKKGTLFVWAEGKYHWMMDKRIPGGKRCFPYAMNMDKNPDDLMEDIWEYDQEGEQA